MSYVTVEVEIEQGRIVPCEPGRLPQTGRGLLTILHPVTTAAAAPRPCGLANGEFVVPPDFNAPLPPEVLREFEGA